MADKKEKKEEGGAKFTPNKKGRLDSLAGNEGISRGLNVATRVALITVAVIVAWKFFAGGPKSEAAPVVKPTVAEKIPSPDFPPIIVNLAGWDEWVRFNPNALPNHSKCYFEGPNETRVGWSTGRESALHEISAHEREVGRPAAFLGEMGTKVTIHCRKVY